MQIKNDLLEIIKANKKEVAQQLGLYEQVLNRWIKTGRISPAYDKLIRAFCGFKKKIWLMNSCSL